LATNLKFDLAEIKCSDPVITHFLKIVANPKDMSQKSNKAVWAFYVTFWVIYLTNVFIINPKLNVWYFVLSTTTISLKLFLTFRATNKSDPGFLVKSLDYTIVLRDVDQTLICPRCKVIRTDSTVHCPVTDKCVDRYD
jgi:hypothetical protein